MKKHEGHLFVVEAGHSREASPDAILLARDAEQVTQAWLAEQVGVSQGMLSKVENGAAPFSAQLCADIARALGYSEDFFYTPPIHQRLGMGMFRQGAALSTPRKTSAARVKLLCLALSRMLRSVDLPEVNLPSVDLERRGICAKEAALTLRQWWGCGVGPIENLFDLIEDAGVLVIPFDFGTSKIDGLSIVDRSDLGLPPIILYNPTAPPDRQRLTVAHELGHLVLHHHLPFPCLELEGEKEANEFASEFLAPLVSIKHHLKTISLASAVTIKRRWGISIQALIFRAKSEGLITAGRYKSLNVQISQKGWRRDEPAMPTEHRPAMFMEIVDAHRNGLGYTDHEMSRVLGFDLGKLTRWGVLAQTRPRVVK